MPPTSHTVLSASASHRWLECPGSIALCKNIPRTTNVYAEEGTAAHKLCEWCLTTPCDAKDKIGKTVLKSSFPDDGPRIVKGFWIVTKEMAEAVQVYLDHIRASYAAMPGSKVVIEQKFSLDWLLDGGLLFGTNDASIIQPFGKLQVNDYKHGAGVAVSANGNPQLKFYGLGALGPDNVNAIEEVEIAITQPRNFSGEAVKTYSMTSDELYQWGREVLLPGAKLALSDNAPLKAGDHCKFCPAAATCPALREKSLAAAGTPFQALATVEPANVSLRSPSTLTIDELERVVAVSGMISDWAKAAAAELEMRLERGEVSQHFKIVAGRGTRKWSEEIIAIDALKQYIDPWSKPELLSPAQAESALKEANVEKKIRDTVIGALTTKTFTRTVAPVTDKRQALPPAGSAFGLLNVGQD